MDRMFASGDRGCGFLFHCVEPQVPGYQRNGRDHGIGSSNTHCTRAGPNLCYFLRGLLGAE